MIKMEDGRLEARGTFAELMADATCIVAFVSEKAKEHDEKLLKKFVDCLIDVAYLGKEKVEEIIVKEMVALLLSGGDDDGSDDDNAEGQE